MKALLFSFVTAIKKGAEEDIGCKMIINPVANRQAKRLQLLVNPRTDQTKGFSARSRLVGELVITIYELPRLVPLILAEYLSLTLTQALMQVINQVGRAIYREEEFMADFLQINDAKLTFADYAGLESYFRRQALQNIGLSASTMKLVKGSLDLVFGFLPEELKQWVDAAIQRDGMCVSSYLINESNLTCLVKLLECSRPSNNICWTPTNVKMFSSCGCLRSSTFV